MPIDPSTTRMFSEAAEAADVVQRQLDRNGATAARIGRRLRELEPRFITTVARGSSDHAACYAKYLLEFERGNASAGGLYGALAKVRHMAESETAGQAPLIEDESFRRRLDALGAPYRFVVP